MFDDIIAPLLTTEWGRRAGWGAMIGMALLFAITFFATITAWHSDYTLVKGAKRTTTKIISGDAMASKIAQLPKEHMFGQVGVQGAALPITSLQLRLIGVVKATPEKYSRVIISQAGQPGKVYQVGDSLPGGVTIYAITDEGVVLDNGGQLEKLPLQRAPLLFQGAPKPLLPEENKQEE